jgi:hypothetical protein
MSHNCKEHARFSEDFTVDEKDFVVHGECHFEVEAGGYSEKHDEYMGGDICGNSLYARFSSDKKNICDECKEVLGPDEVHETGMVERGHPLEVEYECDSCGSYTLREYDFVELSI